jgi:hypothetical protein
LSNFQEWKRKLSKASDADEFNEVAKSFEKIAAGDETASIVVAHTLQFLSEQLLSKLVIVVNTDKPASKHKKWRDGMEIDLMKLVGWTRDEGLMAWTGNLLIKKINDHYFSTWEDRGFRFILKTSQLSRRQRSVQRA